MVTFITVSVEWLQTLFQKDCFVVMMGAVGLLQQCHDLRLASSMQDCCASLAQMQNSETLRHILSPMKRENGFRGFIVVRLLCFLLLFLLKRALFKKNDQQQLDRNMNVGVLRERIRACSGALLSYCSLIIGRARALGVWSHSHLRKYIFNLTKSKLASVIYRLQPACTFCVSHVYQVQQKSHQLQSWKPSGYTSTVSHLASQQHCFSLGTAVQ